MADPLDNLKPWAKGQSGNPGGKPKNARNKLQGDFVNALSKDFDEHGEQAIIDAREKDPVGYIKTIAALLPKQIEQTQPLDDLSDAELVAGIALLRARLTDGSGEGISPSSEPSTAH